MAKFTEKDLATLKQYNQMLAEGKTLTDEQAASQKKLRDGFVEAASLQDETLGKSTELVNKLRESTHMAAEANKEHSHALELKKAQNDREVEAIKLMRDQGVLTQKQYQDELKILSLKDQAIQRQQKLTDKTKETVTGLTGIGDAWKDTIVGSLLTTDDALKTMGKSIKEVASLNNIMGSSMMKVQEATVAMVMSADSALANLNAQTGAAGALNDATYEAFDSTKQFGVSMDMAAQSAGALHQNLAGFSTMNQQTQADMVGTVAQMQKLGISADVSASSMASMQTSLGMTAAESVKQTKSMAAAAVAVGMAPAEMAQGFQQALPKLAAYGKQAPMIFKRVAVAAKNLNVSVDTLLGMTSEMDTFEGAAKAAGKLNSVLGGPLLNSMDLLNATEDERIRLILQSVEASGKS